MNIDKFKHHHIEIMSGVTELRNLSKSGTAEHAAQIAKQISSISATIKLHLSVEDMVLYPALQKSKDPAYVALGQRYQSEMNGLAAAYMEFAKKWLSATRIADDADGFRSDANRVLKALHDRIHKENIELYPVLEHM
ncbi:hemerythrin domain-containing protein [Paralcaligenes ureilyticus]|uniref:Hemerythrin HHE cation binding domain-containing protein n=1 Tax=Paralcaligenes ureilyticus TaxID=627131 RepID=A0A4R3LKS1_9BURK|nr:hemerythrin domain-containing protein [Paralcaligenes ureilyticus]TCT00491.1 hemerythrin HHE cation binding domain-containing protein [Paralcaligenes ureilyticus]